MNDPNGCVYFQGKYHLYYQYHPFGCLWGPMHWGHAESTDLVHWKEQKIALYPDKRLGLAYSGSAVIDSSNVLKLYPNSDNGGGPLFFYTGSILEDKKAGRKQEQHQCIAYTNDDGKTLIPIKENPVIPSKGRADFRDPKVFRHDESDAWIMAVASKSEIEIYRSTNFINWDLSGTVSIDGIDQDDIYECPDIFPLYSDKEPKEIIWVMTISVYTPPKIEAGRSVYVCGTFDGYTFIPREPYQLIDFGMDFYAMQTWNNLPDERVICIAWINHWRHDNDNAATPWQGCMIFPRELKLISLKNGNHRLIQTPVQEISKLRGNSESIRPDGRQISVAQNISLDANSAYEIDIKKIKSVSQKFYLIWSNSLNERVVVSIDLIHDELIFDRSAASNRGFYTDFKPVVKTKIPDRTGEKFDIKIIVDRSVFEIFLCNGAMVLTNLYFISEEFNNLLFKGDTLDFERVIITPLSSIWFDKNHVIKSANIVAIRQ